MHQGVHVRLKATKAIECSACHQFWYYHCLRHWRHLKLLDLPKAMVTYSSLHGEQGACKPSNFCTNCNAPVQLVDNTAALCASQASKLTLNGGIWPRQREVMPIGAWGVLKPRGFRRF
jgi:hypothetical protein